MHLTLHLTTECNMRCHYCYSPPHSGEPMSPSIAAQAMKLAEKHTTGKSASVILFGGEPLLQKDLIREIVTETKKRAQNKLRFDFKLTTNGLLLDEEFLRFAINNDVFIALSFDGIKNAQDAHRVLPGGGGTFDIVREKLAMLIEVRPYTHVLTVVNPDTAPFLAESVEFLIESGVRYLLVSLNFAADWQPKDLATLKKQYKLLAKKYIAWTKEGRKFFFSPIESKLSSHINRHNFRKERCELGRRQLSVDARGNLFPCLQFPRAGADSEWCIGNVFGGIDEQKRQAMAERSESIKEPCKECDIVDRCNNTCGCLNWQTTGDINKVPPVLCAHEKMLMPIADKVGEHLYKKRDPLFIQKHYNAAYPVLSLLEDSERILKK